jgi:hypothetical protein
VSQVSRAPHLEAALQRLPRQQQTGTRHTAFAGVIHKLLSVSVLLVLPSCALLTTCPLPVSSCREDSIKLAKQRLSHEQDSPFSSQPSSLDWDVQADQAQHVHRARPTYAVCSS